MSKKIGGKTFTTPEELGRKPPTEDELARAREIFAEFRRQRDAVPPEDRVTELSPKFWDETSGTEFERRDPESP
ncbi:hypothetical protein [Mycobacterium sp. Aquia_213]|uniref:hypothetical protein n=1 Tax=Mycobacterium sp. Aquia_213 TaxID=2991728 RepID=UPI00226DBD20|nr:hypothetical protein [Mycobacterium sp. Aquia_213]WAC93704.1 hypothetical protein LMQ14_11570 [Mycobacterium sp. Aquia_213]